MVERGEFANAEEMAALWKKHGLIDLTPEEEADLNEALAEMARGEFASDAEVEAVLSKFRR